MGHGQAAEDDLAAGDIDDDAAGGLVVARGAGGVGVAEAGDEFRRAVGAHRQAIQVAAVFGDDVGDERGFPLGDEAVFVAEPGEAGEARVAEPEPAGGVEGEVVDVEVAGEVGGAGR